MVANVIIGNAAVTPAATPGGQVTPPATPTPQSTAMPPQVSFGEEVPQTSTGGAAGTQSFLSTLASKIQQNPLNSYWQTAYHFRLFMAGDGFTLNNISSFQSLIGQINSNQIPQVIIAESGVTGYNIKDVEIESVNAQNGITRDQKATTITMTIVEPMGISFLDAIFGAASQLNIWDYTKVNYFLLLSFTGYNSDAVASTVDGSYAGNPISLGAPFKNGGQWLWALKMKNIEVKLNEGGGVYTLHFITTEAESVIIEEKEFSTMTDGMTVSGTTLGAMFDDFAQQLTDKWAEKFKDPTGKSLMTFKIVTHPIPWMPNLDPKDFSMVPRKPDDSSVRALTLTNNKAGIPTAQLGPATTVNSFIASAIKSTEQGQMLIIDVTSPETFDNPGAETTSTNVRTSTLFSIEPVIDNVGVDGKTNNYVKNITLHVTPTWSQTAILTPTDVNSAKNPAVQRLMILNLQNNGFLSKEYDYIFTGLNTEVMDFHIDFNLAWNALLPKFGGARMQALNEAVHARSNQSVTVAPFPDLPVPDVSNINIQPITQSPNASSNRVYIEDILNSNNQGANATVLPITFYPHGKDAEAEMGTGFVAQWHPGLSIASTVFAQVFGNTITTAFQKIELNIRGDPYWLGQGNLERRVILSGGGSTNDPQNLPDLSSGNPAFILKFKYPLQLGDNFKPILKDSVVFNGIYEVWKVKHTFADGSFKQTLFANRYSLINLGLASSATGTTNTDQTSPSTALTSQSGTQGTPSAGATPGTGNATIAPTGSLPNSQQLQGLAQESYDFWISNGYSPAGASAMVAQEEAESQYGTAPGINVPGVQAGNFQWSPSREAAIQAATGINVGDPTTTHEQQLQAALWEQTQGPYQNVGGQLMTATDPGAAGVLATTKYEIPANTAVQAQIRGGRSAFWAQQFSGNNGS